MCGRFTSYLSPELISATFGVPVPTSQGPRYNIAPTQQVSVVRETPEGRQLSSARWGLVPSWSKDLSIGSHLINARCETVHEKPDFRQSIRYRRCIVPANGFYEWEHIGNEKHPLYIQIKDGLPMGFAGLWDSWNSPDGETVESFSILTTTSNKLLEKIHDRMPVILFPDDYGLWLNHNIHDPLQLQALYEPYPTDKMISCHVSDLVNNPRFDSPACIARNEQGHNPGPQQLD